MGFGSFIKKGFKAIAGVATLGLAGSFIGNAAIAGPLLKNRADRKAALEAGQLRAVQAAIGNKKLDISGRGLDISENRFDIQQEGLGLSRSNIALESQALQVQKEQSQLGFDRLDLQDRGLDVSRAEIDLGEKARDIQTSRANRQTLAQDQIERAKIRAGAASAGAQGSTSSQGQQQGIRSLALDDVKHRGDLRSIETQQANLQRSRLDIASDDLDISRTNLSFQQELFSIQNKAIQNKLVGVDLQERDLAESRKTIGLQREDIALDRELIGHTQGVEDRISKRNQTIAPIVAAGSLVTTGIGLLSGGAGSLLSGFNLGGGTAGGFNSAFGAGGLPASGGGGNFNSGLNF